MSEGYEYDNMSDGMREALEKARENAQGGGVIDLDALMESVGKDWDDEPETPTPAPAVDPKETRAPAEEPPEEEWARMKYEMRQNETRPPPQSPLVEKMASVGWAPQSSPWNPGWSELHEKLAAAEPPPPAPEAPPGPVEPSPEELLLKQASEMEAAQKAADEKAAAEAAERTAREEAEMAAQQAPMQALLQQTGEIEAAQKAEEEKKAAAERAAKERAAAEAAKPKPGPDWDAMLRQLEEAERSRDTMANVGAMLHAAAPGFQAPQGAGQGAVNAAKAAMEVEQRKHKEATDLLEQTKKTALNDPKSAESQRARDAFTSQFPEAAKTYRLEGLSANEIAGLSQREVQLEHYRASDAAAKAKQAEKEAAEKARQAEKEAAERAKEAEKNKNAEDLAKALEAERAAMAKDPRLEKIGLKFEDLADMDRKALDDVRARLQSFKDPKPKGTHNVGVKIEPGKIETVPERRPGYRALVKSIADGRLEAPKPGGRFGAEIISDVLAFKPTFDATRFGAYKKVTDQQAAGKDVIAIDVGLEHLATARKLIPKNADIQWLNKMKQAVATGTGDAEFRPYIAASTVAAHELAKIYNIEDQAGKQMVEHQLSAVQSPEQLAAVFDTFIELVEGKKKGLELQRERVAPKGGEAHAGEKQAGEKPPLETRTSKGATVYRARSGANRWFTTPEEAETF